MTSDNVKVKLISIGNTFATAFILGICASLYTLGTIEWTSTFWIAVIIAGFRAGIAAIVSNFVPVRLGGKRV